MKITKKRGLIAGGVFILLVVAIPWIISYVMISRDSDFIKNNFNTISLPSTFVQQSAEKGSSELATVWRYEYTSSDGKEKVAEDFKAKLAEQGFEVSDRSCMPQNDFCTITAENISKELNIYADLHTTSSITKVYLEVKKCGDICKP